MQMHSLQYNVRQKRIRLWNVDMEKNGKDQLAGKSYRWGSTQKSKQRMGKYRTLCGTGNINLLVTFWDMTFCMKLLKAEWEINQQEGEEFKCYTIWQMTMALLHSNGQLRTERDGDTEKGCQTPIQSCRQAKLLLQNNSILLAKYAVTRLSRKDLKMLVGLLTGHNTLNEHLTLLKIIEDPMCRLSGE